MGLVANAAANVLRKNFEEHPDPRARTRFGFVLVMFDRGLPGAPSAAVAYPACDPALVVEVAEKGAADLRAHLEHLRAEAAKGPQA